MALKVSLAAAILVGLVALASATTITTTVTTASYDREGSQSCSQEVEGREFRACQNYLTQRRSRNADEAEEEGVIETIGSRRQPQQQEEQLLEQCCEQLKEMDRNECGCEAIEQAVRQAQQQQQGSHSSRRQRTGRSQSEQIYEKARELPRMCQLREQQCSINLIFV